MFNKIGLIGVGTMGTSVVKAIIKAREDAEYFFANRTFSKAEAFAAEVGIGKAGDSTLIAESCDCIILAVKPKDLTALMQSISPILQRRSDCFTIISMVTGFSAADIQRLSGTYCPVIYMMPNTPVVTGNGVILYNTFASDTELEKEFADIMRFAGLVAPMNDAKMSIAGSLTGCGPAMVYMLINALADSTVAGGVTRNEAIRLAAQMVRGSAEMVLMSKAHPEELKDKVCSPGGTTIQMVRKLEEKGFRSAVFEALTAASEAKPLR